MKVKECMNNNVKYVSPTNTICEVSKQMCENHIGTILVCDDNKKVVGIVTDRDIILRSLACDKFNKQTPISEIMTTNIITANSDENINEVMKKMAENQVRRIPILENNKLEGIVSIGDLIQCNNIPDEDMNYTLERICNCEDKKNAG